MDTFDISSRLPSSLRHRNIAFLDGETLLVTSRRDLPFCHVTVPCHSVAEAAGAIRGMVTQGGGQLEVALWAMVLEARRYGKDLAKLEEAGKVLSQARKTNTTVERELARLFALYRDLPEKGFARSLEGLVRSRLEDYDRIYLELGRRGEALIEDGMGILTTCFPEHSFFLTLSLARENGKRFCVYTMETRPYMQGAHLTAPGLLEMGYDHALICDNMAPGLIRDGRINIYLTASDLATASGWVINKIGTYGCALACKAHGVPYYAFSVALDRRYDSLEGHETEFRDPDDVKRCQGAMTTLEGVNSLYPAFDIVPPGLVAGIITAEGVVEP